MWDKDVVDVIYFLESLKFVTLNYNIDGTIDWLKVNVKNLEHFNNFNIKLLREWGRPLFEELEYYAAKILEEEKKKRS